MAKFLALLLIAPLIFGCTSLSSQSKIGLTDLGNPCTEDDLSGLAIVKLKKGDLQRCIDTARLEAIENLLESHESIISIYLESYTEAMRKGKREKFVKSFKKTISSKIYPIILKERRFRESVFDDNIVCHVCIDKRVFEESIKETKQYRIRRFNSAVEYYLLGKKCSSDEAIDALNWYTKAKEILEEIDGRDDIYVDERGKRRVLYNIVEREIYDAQKKIKEADILYAKAEKALNESKLHTAKEKVDMAYATARDEAKYDSLAEKIELREQEFRESKEKGDMNFRQGRYSVALVHYEKAAQINGEDSYTEGKIHASKREMTKKTKRAVGKFVYWTFTTALCVGLLFLLSL